MLVELVEATVLVELAELVVLVELAELVELEEVDEFTEELADITTPPTEIAGGALTFSSVLLHPLIPISPQSKASDSAAPSVFLFLTRPLPQRNIISDNY